MTDPTELIARLENGFFYTEGGEASDVPDQAAAMLRILAAERDQFEKDYWQAYWQSYKHCQALAKDLSEIKAERDAAIAERDAMKAELCHLYRAYVRTLENGRDRILMLQGDCDSLDYMENGDPALIRARAALNPEAKS